MPGIKRLVKLAQQFLRDGIRGNGVSVLFDVLGKRIKHAK